MIIFNFESKELFEKCHKALKGSPAYISSEIAIIEDRDLSKNGFQLVVGVDNDNNVMIDIGTKGE